MSRKQVILELRPGRIDIVVQARGRVTGTRRLVLEAEHDALEWAKSVRRTGATLKGIVEELGVTGAPTTVLYRSPTQAIDLVGLAVSSAAQATEAARMSLTDALPYSALTAVCEAAVVGRDAKGGKRDMHVVAAAEREDIAEAIVEMVETAGLHFQSATPIEAAAMARATSMALGTGAGVHGRLYLGENASSFLVVADGTILFSRRIDLGVDALVNSLTRPITLPGRAEPVQFDREKAQRLVHEFGVPDRNDVLDEALDLRGFSVIPLLQPVLQRFIVDLRQTIRFGLDESHRDGLTITLTGPGSTIPRLAALMGRELGAEIETDPTYSLYRFDEIGGPATELHDALQERAFLKRMSLLPRPLAAARRFARTKRWLWTGAAAAIAMIAVDGFRHHASLAETRREARAVEASMNESRALEETSGRLKEAIEAMRTFDGTLAAEVGARIDSGACLHELSRVVPTGVRLTHLALRRLGDGMRATLNGFAVRPADGAMRTSVEPFIHALRESPLFADVVLGNVQVSTLDDVDGERFEVTFRVVAIPRLAATGTANGTATQGAAK